MLKKLTQFAGCDTLKKRLSVVSDYKTPRETSEILGISIDRLRRLAENSTISTIRTPGGQRRYDVQGYIDAQTETDITTIGYCRVSGKGESEDLASQVAYLQTHYPEAEIIRDFGSGINFKRKGLISLLERVLRGDKLRVVVAHRDRLARFGGEVIQFLVEQNGGEVVVLDILLPTFESKQMTKRGHRKLRRKSVRQMLTLSHYRFKMFLKHKALEYGVRVIDVCEAYTSKTVSWTGEIITNLGGSKVIKSSKGHRMDRDLNGARGIFIKSVSRALAVRPST